MSTKNFYIPVLQQSIHSNILFKPINLYNKFVLTLLQKGIKFHFEQKLKSFWVKYIEKKKLRLSFIKHILFFFFRLQTFVEVRTVTYRRQINQVPFFIMCKRQIFFALSNLKKFLVKKFVPITFKIQTEYRKIIKKLNSEVVFNIIKNNVLAYKNRSNAKFRW